jgi:alkylated DNA repair dioxygenase AlkB
MSQLGLFSESAASWESLSLPDADLKYCSNWLRPEKSERLFQYFLKQLDWKTSTLILYGREQVVPRLNVWYGDEGANYYYSGANFNPRPFDPELNLLRESLQAELGAEFNSVLANLYRDGNDSVSWHADDEWELGPQPLIASLSLGAPRRFSLKPIQHSSHKPKHIELASGSLLVMAGGTQQHWHHQVPKVSSPIGPRINLTFRLVKLRS